MVKRLLLRVSMARATLALATAALAQDAFPTKPLRMIVPAAPGGSTDIGAPSGRQADGRRARATRDRRQPRRWRRPHRPADVARSTPDGYTLLYGNSIGQALLPAVVKSLGYDPIKNFTPVGGAFWYSTLIVCNPNVPFSDLKGLVEHAKKNSGKLNVATAGQGSGNHFSSELLSSMAGIQVTHVPYKGNAPATQDVMAGLADCIHIGEAKPYLDSGKLKRSPRRAPSAIRAFPNVPTVDEAGLKGFDVTWWQGVFAPAGTSPEVMAKLTDALRKVVEQPGVKATMFDAGFVPEYLNPADLNLRIQRDMAKFRKIAADARLEVD